MASFARDSFEIWRLNNVILIICLFMQTLIAKKSHFEYITPRKTLFFRDELDHLGDETEVPLKKKCRLSRISCEKKASKISVALFKWISDHLDLRIRSFPLSCCGKPNENIGHHVQSHDPVSSRALVEELVEVKLL